MDNRTQLFRLGPKAFELLFSMSEEDFDATTAALIECNLYRLPYDKIDLQFVPNQNMLQKAARENGRGHSLIDHIIFRDVELVPMNENQFEGLLRVRARGEGDMVLSPRFRSVEMYASDGSFLQTRGFDGDLGDKTATTETMVFVTNCLIVLLATKGIEKQVQHFPKRARRDTHISHRHSMVTTITGAAREYTASTGEGTSPRTHMRRGHVRRQHYGPQNSLIKKVFIEPCVVNADQGEWHEREAYNVSMNA